jgi:signal transduction histidine kinase/ActR/RegA family two-component response regulator
MMETSLAEPAFMEPDTFDERVALLDQQGMIVAVTQDWPASACSTDAHGVSVHAVGLDYLHFCQQTAHHPPGTADTIAQGIRAVLDGRQSEFQFDYPNHAQHEPRWHRLSVMALRGRHRGALVWRGNITARMTAARERKSLERQLRESQKMELVGAQACGIVHDLNNILAAILGNAELARASTHGDAQALESLQEISKAGIRARTMVRQLQSFIQRRPMEYSRTSVTAVIEESAKLLRIMLSPNVVLTTRCESDTPPVLGDANQIVQIILNLAINAEHAIAGRAGRVSLVLDCVSGEDAAAQATQSLPHAGPARFVRLTVSDNGPGMPERTLQRIFEPFFTTKPAGEGTGLGLAVVKSIVQDHKGTISVTSNEGQGTSFTLLFPAAECGAGLPEPTAHAITAAPTPDTANGQHVLYVDDDESLGFMVRRLLARRGFRVSTFATPAAALEALRSSSAQYDIVVTDHNMGVISGLVVAREVRSIRPDLPVAMVSGYIDDFLRLQAAEAGIELLIHKTTLVEDLGDAVQRMVSDRID